MNYAPEQVAVIINSTSRAIAENQPQEPNYAWLALLGVIPVIVGYLLNKRKKK